jgi:hypothetical protein
VNLLLSAVQFVTEVRGDLRQSIGAERLGWLLGTEACGRCVAYLARHPSRVCVSEGQLLLDGGRLLFILAAMQAEDCHERDEVLCLMGTRGVDAYGAPRGERLRMAALARRRPLRDPRWYRRSGQLADTQRRLADGLHALVSCAELLDRALTSQGDMAVSRYL